MPVKYCRADCVKVLGQQLEELLFPALDAGKSKFASVGDFLCATEFRSDLCAGFTNNGADFGQSVF